MKVGDKVNTPRFLKVEISKIFNNRSEAYKEGFKEPTYYSNDPEWDVYGKSIDVYCMEFAAVRK